MTAIPTDVFDVAVRVLRHARSHDATVLFVGNGGSASTASHMGNDFSKATIVAGKRRMRVISLTDNVALIYTLDGKLIKQLGTRGQHSDTGCTDWKILPLRAAGPLDRKSTRLNSSHT